ncbi:MAG: EscU/YscU/HrcU family type III secretion system export apparatus switch protein [Intestinimonas sp.]|jgi:flagellar biosynthesis protein|nr:EscU/YscU/HrcU family type III secretion system export apparatus switch protein [Intestinimonas sp.]
MSKPDRSSIPAGRAVALQYDGAAAAPVIVASGMGYLAEKIVEVAADNGVPVYEDNSLATMLSQLELGQEIPSSLYQAIVDIYIYFLEFDPTDPDKPRRRRTPEQDEGAQIPGEEENNEV